MSKHAIYSIKRKAYEMNEYTTKAGTKLPLLNLKGKPYLQVAYRLVWLREEHPEWRITCEFLRSDDKTTIAKASIYDGHGQLIGVAHKREDAQHFADHLEKAETSAIGRALAMLGYGTQFCADELDEGGRLADSPVPPVKKSMGINPGIPTADDGNLEPTHYKVPFGKYAQKTLEEIGVDDLRSYVAYLEKKAKADGKVLTGNVAEFVERVEDYVGSFENQPQS